MRSEVSLHELDECPRFFLADLFQVDGKSGQPNFIHHQAAENPLKFKNETDFSTFCWQKLLHQWHILAGSNELLFD